VIRNLRAFWDFWWDFIVGDDWLVAASVVGALAITYGVSKTSVASWWIVPAALVIVLPVSLRRAIRRH
jgi:hypothetical protein